MKESFGYSTMSKAYMEFNKRKNLIEKSTDIKNAKGKKDPR